VLLAYLQEKYPEYKWTPQVGGLSIPKNIADELFFLVQGNSKFSFVPESEQEIKLYAEGRSKSITYCHRMLHKTRPPLAIEELIMHNKSHTDSSCKQ
jgi:hypothetical protein